MYVAIVLDSPLFIGGTLASLKVSCMETTPDGSVWIGSKRNGLTRIKGSSSTIYSLVKDSVSTL
ncbi:MAG: hypothetical protein IIU29_00890, partial [Erysipelotrichaceae bacterium]|nr:hypothetical protein [Erysipelotrichaceae bacterium]